MREIFTLKTTLKLTRLAFVAFLTLSLSQHVNGQTLWGAGSSVPASDEAGRFANAFGGSNAWTAVAVTNGALWTRTTTGVSQGSYWGTNEAFKSPTLADGAALFDSDYMDTKLSLEPPQKGELYSPKIDLTGLADGDAIQVKMFLYYRFYAVDEFSVGFSSDGGTTWKNFPIDVLGNTVNKAFGQSFVAIKLKDVTKGVTDFSNCKLRLVFNGDSYFAMVDDLSIEIAPAYDIAFPSGDAYDYRSTFSPTPYAQIPLRYAQKANDNDFLFGAIVVNLGAKEIPVSAHAKLTCELLKSAGGGWTSLVKKDISITKAIGVSDSALVKGDLTAELNAAFTANGVGNYRFNYHLSHDLSDFDASNNDRYHDFTVTEDYNTWFSAPPIDVDGNPTANSYTFPSADAGYVVQTLEQGVYFYFPDQTDLSMESVKYGAFLSSTLPDSKSINATVKVYSVPDMADLKTISLVALGLDTVVASADNKNKYSYKNVSLYDVSSVGPTYKLNNKSGLYIVAVSQSNINGLITMNDEKQCFYPAGYKSTYRLGSAFNGLYRLFLKVGQGAPGQAEDIKFYGSYSGEPFVPSIAVKMIDSKTVGLSDVKVSLDEKSLKIFPNPVTDRLNLEIQLSQPTSNASIILTEINGRVLHLENRSNVHNLNYSLNTEQLLPGTYFVHIKTDQGNISKKFVKY